MAAPGPSLAEVLRPEALMPVLRDPSVLAELAPHLPEQHRCEGVGACKTAGTGGEGRGMRCEVRWTREPQVTGGRRRGRGGLG